MVYTQWKYRVKIGINNPVNIADYQINVTIPYRVHMNSDFSDIRFSDVNGNELNYWIESYTSFVSASVWVKCPNNCSEFYLYYGNSSTTSASNGINTFLFFDDMNYVNETELTTNGWIKTGTPTLTFGNSIVQVQATSVGQTIRKSIYANLQNYVIETMTKIVGTTGTINICLTSLTTVGSIANTDTYGWIYPKTTGTDYRWGNNLYTTSSSATQNAYVILSWKHEFGTSKAYENYILKATHSWTPPAISYIVFGEQHDAVGGGGQTTYTDWIRVRKYASTEPTCVVSVTNVNPFHRRNLQSITIYTKTYSIDSLFKKLDTNKNYVIDTLIKKLNSERNEIIDILFKKLDTNKNYNADILLKKLDTNKNYDLDTLLKTLNSEKTYDLDTLFKTLNLEKSYDVDLLLKNLNAEKTYYQDVLIKILNTESNYNIDSIIHKISEINYSIDILTKKLDANKNYNLDILLRNLNSEKSYNQDVLIKTLNTETDYNQDVLIKTLNIDKNYSIDNRIVLRPDEDYNIDTLLKLLDDEKTYNIDILTKKLDTNRNYSIDSLLRTFHEKTYLIDVLTKKLDADKNYNVDVLTKTLDIDEDYLIDTLMKLENNELEFLLDTHITRDWWKYNIDCILLRNVTFKPHINLRENRRINVRNTNRKVKITSKDIC